MSIKLITKKSEKSISNNKFGLLNIFDFILINVGLLIAIYYLYQLVKLYYSISFSHVSSSIVSIPVIMCIAYIDLKMAPSLIYKLNEISLKKLFNFDKSKLFVKSSSIFLYVFLLFSCLILFIESPLLIGILLPLFIYAFFLKILDKQLLDRLLNSILLLIFVVPFEWITKGALSMWIQLKTAFFLDFILSIFNVEFNRSGIFLDFPDVTIVIDSTCSGLNTILSVLIYSMLFCSILGFRYKHRFFIGLLTVPVGFFINLMRVLTLSVCSLNWEDVCFEHFWHDTLGYINFFLFFILFWVILVMVFYQRKLSD